MWWPWLLPSRAHTVMGHACLHACLFRVGNILGAGLLKDCLSAFPLATIVCMD